MFKASITRFLLASLGILMAGLFLAALILAVTALNNYVLAGGIARLTSTDKTLFNALITVRAQIPKDSTALITEDDPRALIDATYEEASRAVNTALEALESADIANHGELAAAIRRTWRAVTALQSTVQVQAAQARSQRNLHAIDAWRTAIHDMLETVSTASVTVGNTVRIGDPLIAEMVQIRRIAWTIRDRYGLQCSMLRPNVDTSQPLSPIQIESWHGNRAVYTYAWRSLDDLLLRPGASAAIRGQAAAAQKVTEEAQLRVDQIVGRFDGSGQPAVASAEWTALCDRPFDSILAIAQQAQDQADRRAEAIRTASFRILLAAGMALISVVGFGAFAVVNVQRRLARPMRILTDAIARLGRRDFETPVPSTKSPDELGSMAQALESLRASASEAERLQQAMSRFTADASHQMRTPLTVLRTHISVLGSLIPPHSEAHASFKDIEEAADRLQRLLIQLLKLAQADRGGALGQELEIIDLRSVIQEIAAGHVPQGVEAGVELHFEAEQRRFPARVNQIMIHEIFANLIDNAIRYNNPGGHVVIRLFDQGGKHVVEVEDDGPGIPDTETEKVFTRFYRMNRDQSRTGSGLGLAIVQSLAAMLNAEINLHPGAVGRGLLIRISWAEPSRVVGEYR